MKTHDIPMNLRVAYLSMHRQTNAVCARYGVTADQYVCMFILGQEDGIIQKELVKRANSDPNTIRAMLVLLEKKGYVSRTRDPADGRAQIVTLTEEGRKIFDVLTDELEPVRRRMTLRLSEEDALTLNRLLKRITGKMRG